MRLVSRASLRRRSGLWLRAALAVALGVASLIAVDLISRSVSEGFENSLLAAAGRTDLRVDTGEGGMSEDVLELVRGVPGVKAAVPVVETPAYVVGSDGEVLTVLGVDITAEGEVRRYEGATEDTIEDPLVFLSQADSIVLTHAFAAGRGLGLGDRLQLQTPLGPRQVTVRGLLAPEGPAIAFDGRLAVMDYQAAQVMFAKDRRLDAVDVVAQPGAVEALKDRLVAVLPAGFRVAPPASRAADTDVAIASVRFLLWLVASLALVVAMFLVANTVSMSVAQRGREIAVLRALGLRRREVVWLIAGEALIVAVAGSAAGVFLGLGLGKLLLAAVTTSLNSALFLGLSTPSLAGVGAGTVALALCLGMGTTLAAAWLPARTAARFHPAAAARRDAVIALRQGRSIPWWAGLVAIGAAALLDLIAIRTRQGGLGPWADGAFVLGAASLAVPLLRALLPVLQALPWRPVERLAVLNLGRNVVRSARTVAPLMVAMTFVVTVASVIQSFRTSLAEWLDSLAPLDLQIASVSQEVGRDVLLPETFGDQVAAVPGVAGVQRFRQVHVQYEGRRIAIDSKDFDPADPDRCCVRFIDGDPVQAFDRLARGEAVVVSENFADKFRIGPGDAIKLPTPQGLVRLPVAATSMNYNSDQGTVMLARTRLVELFGDRRIDQVLVRVRDGVDPDRVRGEIARRWGQSHQLVIFSIGDLRRDILRRLDTAFRPATALFALAIIIGCLGVASSLFVAVSERVREVGLLRSLGMRRRDVWRLVLGEATLLGVVGVMTGMVLASGLSYLWVAVHVRYILGWALRYDLSWAGALVGGLVMLVTAPLAGWMPARAAAAVPPTVALADE